MLDRWEGVHPPASPGWADFTIMTEYTPESGHFHFVYSVVIPGTFAKEQTRRDLLQKVSTFVMFTFKYDVLVLDAFIKWFAKEFYEGLNLQRLSLYNIVRAYSRNSFWQGKFTI